MKANYIKREDKRTENMFNYKVIKIEGISKAAGRCFFTTHSQMKKYICKCTLSNFSDF